MGPRIVEYAEEGGHQGGAGTAVCVCGGDDGTNGTGAPDGIQEISVAPDIA